MDLKSVDNFFFWNGSVRLWLENVVGLQYVTTSHVVIIYVIASKTRDKWGTQIQEYLGPKLLLWGKRFMFTTPILVYLWFKYITKWHIYVFYFFFKVKKYGSTWTQLDPFSNLLIMMSCFQLETIFDLNPDMTRPICHVCLRKKPKCPIPGAGIHASRMSRLFYINRFITNKLNKELNDKLNGEISHKIVGVIFCNN